MNKAQLDKIQEALEFMSEQWDYCVENHGTEPMEDDDPCIQRGFDALAELKAELERGDVRCPVCQSIAAYTANGMYHCYACGDFIVEGEETEDGTE